VLPGSGDSPSALALSASARGAVGARSRRQLTERFPTARAARRWPPSNDPYKYKKERRTTFVRNSASLSPGTGNVLFPRLKTRMTFQGRERSPIPPFRSLTSETITGQHLRSTRSRLIFTQPRSLDCSARTVLARRPPSNWNRASSLDKWWRNRPRLGRRGRPLRDQRPDRCRPAVVPSRRAIIRYRLKIPNRLVRTGAVPTHRMTSRTQ